MQSIFLLLGLSAAISASPLGQQLPLSETEPAGQVLPSRKPLSGRFLHVTGTFGVACSSPGVTGYANDQQISTPITSTSPVPRSIARATMVMDTRDTLEPKAPSAIHPCPW
jgi:hypothetical protein